MESIVAPIRILSPLSGRNPLLPAVAGVFAMAMCAATAGADELAAQPFVISGFGTLGAVHSSERRADFTSTFFKPNGAGASHDWSIDVDSLLGLQGSADLAPQLSAVLQIIAEQNYDNTYRPHVEWANVRYEFTPEFSVRVGRTSLPTFMVADSRRIGYSNPWVRPPVEVYRLTAVTSNDGIDATYRLAVGSATNTFHLTAGRSDSKFPGNGVFEAGVAQARNQASVVSTFEKDNLTVRFALGRTRLTIPQFAPLFDAFRQFGSEGAAIAERYALDDTLITVRGVGASYDPGPWFAMGEWGRINTRSVLGERSAWYVSGGYRVGKFTPYATYARISVQTPTSDPGLTVSALPPPLAGPAIALNAALNTLLRSGAVQTSVSVGSRWDFTKNAAFKLQADRVRNGDGSAGTLSNIQPGFQIGRNLTVISATIDFVF